MKKVIGVFLLGSLAFNIAAQNNKVYKSPEGKRLVFELYDKMLKKLSFKFESTYINTRFGKTHLLIGGDESLEPLFVFHGGNGVNPQDLILYERLTQNYRIYAPDIIGFPGKSDEIALSPKNDDYGKWVVDLLDELGIKKASFMGYSCGGGVLMRLAAYAPERISKAILVNPMGIGLGSMLNMIFKLVIPYLSYIKSPSKEKLIHQLEPLYEKNEMSEDLLEGFGCIYLNTYIVSATIKPPSKKELLKFTAPTMLIASENDIMFPANKIITKARKNIPNLIKIKTIEKGKHGVAKRDWQVIIKDILEFL